MTVTMEHKISKEENAKYRKKYSLLKRAVKKFVYENAALCDQVFQLQERIICAIEERNYLSARLAQHIPPPAPQKPEKTEPLTIPSNSQKPPPRKRESGEKGKPRIPRQTGGLKRKAAGGAGAAESISRPVFPVKLNNLSIHSLGEIVTDRLIFHREDVIYPVGFCSTRLYGSLLVPTNPSVYTCMILDGGASPLFQISSDVSQEPIISGLDINVVHSRLLQRINLSLGTEVVSTRGRGADFFGLTHPTVVSLINAMPAASKCLGYKMAKAGYAAADEGGASVKFETLQRSIMFTRSQMESMRQQETLDSTTTLRDLLNA